MEPLVWSGSADGVLGGTCCLAYALGLQTKPLAREGRSRCLEPKWGAFGWPTPLHFLPDQGRPLLSGFTGGHDGSDTVLEEV